MQTAARRVAWENGQLRILLAKKGVPSEEVEEFLRQEENSVVRAGSKILSTIGSSPANLTPCNRNGASLMSLETSAVVRKDTPRNSQCVTPITPKSTCNDKSNQSSCCPTTRPFLNDPAIKPLPDEPSNNVPLQQYIPNTIPQDLAPVQAGFTQNSQLESVFEMSCETAASIISGMRGNGDQEQIRERLGCAGKGPCSVKNTTVFEVMSLD